MFGRRKKNGPPPVAAVVVSYPPREIAPDELLIDDMPLVARSLLAFDACASIVEIVLVCREEDVAAYYALAQDYAPSKISSVVTGGDTWQAGVFSGVDACSREAAYFAIHDGARALVEETLIEQCIAAACKHGAAAAAVPVKDTLKFCDADGIVTATPARASLVTLQTPQVFEAGLYRRAMAEARHSRLEFADDCQLIAHAGGKISTVPGSYENIRITNAEALAHASAILAYRREGAEAWLDFV